MGASRPAAWFSWPSQRPEEPASKFRQRPCRTAPIPAFPQRGKEPYEEFFNPVTAMTASTPFAPLTGPIGFYPVVHDAAWVQRLLDWGVRTIQLRFKAAGHTPAEIEREVNAAVEAGSKVPGAQVFINDHWQLALAAGAYGVHLGQEDLDTADIEALRSAGLRLGLSTHTPAELARAHAVQPSYLAIGPIYPTTLKVMPYEPVGSGAIEGMGAAGRAVSGGGDWRHFAGAPARRAGLRRRWRGGGQRGDAGG